MPTYEYECLACGHTFEKFQRMSDEPVRTCPECGKRKVRRLISSGGGIVFRGPGFYATDYRKPAPGASGEKGDAAERAGKGGDGAGGSGSSAGGGKDSENKGSGGSGD